MHMCIYTYPYCIHIHVYIDRPPETWPPRVQVRENLSERFAPRMRSRRPGCYIEIKARRPELLPLSFGTRVWGSVAWGLQSILFCRIHAERICMGSDVSVAAVS